MSLKNIYYALSKHYSVDYYTKLAKTDAMLVPVLIDIISDNYFEFDKRKAENILESISRTNPELVYPYFDYLCDITVRDENLIFWNILMVISNLLSCDYLNKWENRKEVYFSALNSDIIAKFSIACNCAVNVVKHKYNDAKRVKKILLKVREKSSYSDSPFAKVAGEKADETLKTIENDVLL